MARAGGRTSRSREADVHLRALLLAACADQFRQAMQGLRTEHKVHERGALDDRFAFLRGNAAAHADDDLAALVLQALPHAELAEHLLLRLLADGAGVDQDDVGVVRAVGQFQAIAGGKHVGHLGRVVLVHLATVGLDVQLALDLVRLARTSGQGNERVPPGVAGGKTSGVPVMALNPFGWRESGQFYPHPAPAAAPVEPSPRSAALPASHGAAWHGLALLSQPSVGSALQEGAAYAAQGAAYAAASSASICRDRSKAVIALIRAM